MALGLIRETLRERPAGEPRDGDLKSEDSKGVDPEIAQGSRGKPTCVENGKCLASLIFSIIVS